MKNKIKINWYWCFEYTICLIPTITVWRNDFRNIEEMNFVSYGVGFKFLRLWAGTIINIY